MGLRRRLSKKWNETVNGVLSGPGVDVDSVNTDEVGNAGSPVSLSDVLDLSGNQIQENSLASGSTVIWSQLDYALNASEADYRTQLTESVGTSATAILTLSDGVGIESDLVTVVGRDGAATEWTDLVQVLRTAGAITIVSSTDSGSGSDGRSYSISGNELQLAMAAGSYNVVASSTHLSVDP